MSRLPLGALKCPADPPDWWSAVTDTLGRKPWRGRKRKLRSEQQCGEGKKRREDDGKVQVRSLFGLQIFFLKKRDGMQILIGFPGALASKDEHIK